LVEKTAFQMMERLSALDEEDAKNRIDFGHS
jgi:hypothetical protein